MSKPAKSQFSTRKNAPGANRRTFAELASEALRFRVQEPRFAEARWNNATNLAWVSWKREDGRWAYACIRRKLAMINGELGVSAEPFELEDLPLVTRPEDIAPEGGRVLLGNLLHGHTKAWSAGGSEKALIERLDWIAQQLNLRLIAFMSATRKKAA